MSQFRLRRIVMSPKRTLAMVLFGAAVGLLAIGLFFLRYLPEFEVSARSTDRQATSVEQAPHGQSSDIGKHESLLPSASPSTRPKLVHSTPEQVSDGNYAELLPGLKQKANAGDAIAAYQIWTMLEDCKRMFRGQDDDSTNKKRLDKCNGVMQDDLDAAVKWLQTAADAGSAQAMQSYSLYGSLDLTMTDALRDPQAIQDYKDRSKRYLDTLVAAGSPSAMTSLAGDYYHGIMLPQNFQLACAYEFAAFSLIGRAGDPMFYCPASLTAEQIEAAKEMGRRMIAACCPNGPPHEFWKPEGGPE